MIPVDAHLNREVFPRLARADEEIMELLNK